MKPLYSLLLFTGLLLAAPLAAEAESSTTAAVRLPDHRTVHLDNGLTVVLMERRQLPLVSIHWRLRSGGAIADPAGREGLARLTAQLLRQGTRSRPAREIASAVDFVGGTLDADASAEFAFGAADFASKDTFLALDLVADILMNPAFPAGELRKLARQGVDGIRDGKTVPGEVIDRYYDAFLFGSHPYGTPASGTESSLPRITRSHVRAFHEAHYLPNQLILAVVGDFSTPVVEARVREKFGTWKARTARVREITPPPRNEASRALVVDKPDATQTFFRFGDVALARTNRDWVAVEAVNTLFGQRFTSMLNTALRIDSGLTYHARSYFDARRQPGSFAIYAYTQNDTTGRALDLAVGVLQRLHDQGLTAAQLASVKAYLKGQFGPRLQTNEQLAGLMCDLAFYGLGPEEINDYFQRIDALTLDDTRRVIDMHFPKDRLAYVFIGRKAVIEPVARKLAGQVTCKAINDPGF